MAATIQNRIARFGNVEMAWILAEMHTNDEGKMQVHRALEVIDLGRCPLCDEGN
jgi:hypothetical protein